MLYVFEENGDVPASIANGAGIAINRNASGPITARIPPGQVPATTFEFHSVEDQPFSVEFPVNEAFASGGALVGTVVLSGKGSTLLAKHTAPGLWTGFLGT